jgi:hypothetical protein
MSPAEVIELALMDRWPRLGFRQLAVETITALEAAGFVIVPAEPTEDMVLACWTKWHPWGINAPPPQERISDFTRMEVDVRCYWRAMLAARPRT